jgi:hypothetical protein
MRKIQSFCAVAAFGFLFGSGIYVSEVKAQTVPMIAPTSTSGQIAGCGSWLLAREKQDSFARGYQLWVTGFLSGAAFIKNGRNLEGLDTEGLYLWLDNYCRSNPVKPLREAAISLSVHLGLADQPFDWSTAPPPTFRSRQ